MKLPVGQIKGLYTNVDSNDISSEYVQKAQNVRFRNGYAISEGFNLQSIPKPEGQILWLESVELDEDRLKTKVVDGEIIFDYSQRLFTTYLLIVKSDKVHFYLYQIGADSWREIIPQFELPEELEIRTVVNRYGTVRIYTDQETLWLGKISRHWKQLNGITSIFNDYYLDRLIEPFDRTNLGIEPSGLLTIKCAEGRRLGVGIIPEVLNDPNTFTQNNPVEIDFLDRSTENSQSSIVPRTVFNLNRGILNNSKIRYNIYRFTDLEEEINLTNPGYGDDGTVQGGYVLKCPATDYYVFFEQGGNNDVILIPERFFRPGDSQYHLKFVSATPGTIVTNPFVHNHDGSPVALLGRYYAISKTEFLNVQLEFIGYGQIGETGFEPSSSHYELVVTGILDGIDEYVMYHEKEKLEVTGKFGFRFTYLLPTDINKRITSLGFYLRFRDKDDFEQIKIIDLLSHKTVNQFIIDSLSPNGTFLVQTIGTLYDPDTFKVISVPDDSKVIDGISYIIKDRAVYHSAVGGGKILENTYYPENVIPSVEGTFLIDVNTYPAVADLLNTRITLLSVVADEGVFLFATKDTYSYELKDRFDVVEMPEGCIFNTRQGIILSNGESVDFISEPINDICEREFDNSSIYFDRIRGEIFLSTQNGVFRYWTLSQSWSQINAIEGYRLRFSLSGDKSIGYTPESLVELTYGAKRGIVVLHPVSFNELRIAKVLNSVTFDFEGTLKFNGKEVNLQQRGESIFKMKLFQRIPVIKFRPEFEFEGTFYGMELNYEVAGELIK